jgi:hypothetical protein
MSFTELEVARLAAYWGMLPKKRWLSWTGDATPDFIIRPGDIGRVIGGFGYISGWDTIEERESLLENVRSKYHTLDE